MGKKNNSNSYNAEMPQCLPAMFPAAPKSDNPTMTMAGAIVRGVMNRRIKPTIPSKKILSMPQDDNQKIQIIPKTPIAS